SDRACDLGSSSQYERGWLQHLLPKATISRTKFRRVRFRRVRFRRVRFRKVKFRRASFRRVRFRRTKFLFFRRKPGRRGSSRNDYRTGTQHAICFRYPCVQRVGKSLLE
ncbi:MAG: hypothetical protein CV081_12980, partial [Nitrospira sp. LK265]|nr:hypothetical protein [Nitrospira sp. LK265]